jgi:cellulase/cellobiase CelA1
MLIRKARFERRRATLALSGVTVVAIAMATLVATTMPSGAATTRTSDSDVGILAASAGCGRAPTLTSGTRTIQSGGTTRSFILRVPNNYDMNRQYRLIFGFHWLNGNAGNVAGDYYGLLPLSNNSAIFVAPEGISNGWANTNGRDVTFTDDMIRVIQEGLCVDTSQIFSLGFSYGGGMSYALACARANVFRAVAVYAGGVISGCSGGNSPIGYMGVHGISDNVLSISGGRSMRDRFVRNNGCAAANPPEPSQGSGQRTEFHYSGCTHPTAWYAFDGGHTGSPPGNWLPGETWTFFNQFAPNPPPPPPNPNPPPPNPPPPNPPPPNPPPPNPPPPPGGCTASVSLNQWTGGFVATVRVTAGSSAINGWQVAMTIPSGATVTNAWNAQRSGNSGAVTFSNVSYNGQVGAGQATEFGFQGTGSGSGMTPGCTAS